MGPLSDIFETDDAFWVVVALPGVDLSGVEVSFAARRLAVRCRRALPAIARQAVVHRLELLVGDFERVVEFSADRSSGGYELGEVEAIHGSLVLRVRKVR